MFPAKADTRCRPRLGHFGFVRGTGSELCRIALWNYIWDVIASLVAILVKIEQRERVITISRE